MSTHRDATGQFKATRHARTWTHADWADWYAAHPVPDPRTPDEREAERQTWNAGVIARLGGRGAKS